MVERRETEPADFYTFGDLGAFRGADEVDAGFRQSLVDDREDVRVRVGSFVEANDQGIFAARHAVAEHSGAMNDEKGLLIFR